MPEKKVEVNKLAAFIPLKIYIKYYDEPNIVFHIKDFNYVLTYTKSLSSKETLVYDSINKSYKVYNTDELYVKDIIVRFKEIENYTHYQTELNFNEYI